MALSARLSASRVCSEHLKTDTIFNMKKTIQARAFIIFCLTMICLSALVGCETEDDNKLASAQDCLDNLKDTHPDSRALQCKNIVNGMRSPQSYVIRCSVGFFVGGVKATDVATAFEDYEEAEESEKAALLMVMMRQDTPAEARETYNDCLLSKVPSLIYLATVSKTGTLLVDGAGGDTNPATLLATCANGGSGGVCEDEEIGESIINMYDSYCVGDAAENQVCSEMASAIAAGSGDPAAIAIALYGLLQ
jgi:hypothetical protein